MSEQPTIDISILFPPNIKDIRKAFGEIPNNAVFAYDFTIFNPSGLQVTEPMFVHEATHIAQQGRDFKKWWKKYCKDLEFRFSQELEAFSNEYNSFRTHNKNREQVNKYLHSCALRLSSDLYGKMRSYSEALTLIKNHADSGYSKKR